MISKEYHGFAVGQEIMSGGEQQIKNLLLKTAILLHKYQAAKQCLHTCEILLILW